MRCGGNSNGTIKNNTCSLGVSAGTAAGCNGGGTELNKFLAEIVCEVTESYDEFIFETVRPFCEKTVKQKITKETLTEALFEYKERHPEKFLPEKDTEV